ncbi:MAG: hypothetical protein BXU00_01010 [Candidatus Nanoclepta minutus]|uniref:Methyltransferase type 11 domain-containing protein n=1 Tax=Candidatus Nanoclepta minutus TaxID=1940235 RepID=A0A397WNK9_9ARCH|nr:MAG: hypothetical protein BXU00_01010 [Candidatus Nanoclepta minutus]
MDNNEYDERVVDYYNNLSDVYDELYGEEQNKKIRIIEEIYNRLFGSKVFEKGLDYGCGTGISSIFLSKISKEVYIYDISEKMIEIAKNKVKNAIPVKINDLGNYLGFFDVVLSVTVLQDSKDPEKDLELIFKLLKEEGLLILSVLKKKGLAFWKPLIKKYFNIIWFYEEDKDFIFFLIKKIKL